LFTAKIKESNVELTWQTATEVNNYGFEIERTSLDDRATWEMIGFVDGSSNSNSVKQYSFVDESVDAGKYLYRLNQIDNDIKFEYSDVVEVDVNLLSVEFVLEQNYPNPFNPTTRIEYQLPVNSLVKLELYSITGKKVPTLVNEELEAGYYNITLNADELRLASGVYFYRLICKDYTSIKKMLLLK